MDSIFKYLLSFFSLYFLMAACFTEAVNFAPWNFYNIYTLIVLLSIASMTIVGAIRPNGEFYLIDIKILSYKNLVLIGIITILWFLIRYQVFVHGLIWFDEATHYVPYWRMHHAIDSVRYAAIQQQMPLDYYTAYAVIKLFGLSPDVMLFHPRIYGLLSCGLFFLLLLRFNFKWSTLLIAMAIYLSQVTFLRYSSEARPIGLVILLGLINFYYFHKYLNSKDNNFFYELLPSSLLLVLSTALQPILHLFVLTFFFKLKCKDPVKSKRLELNLLLSILVSLPLMWLIYNSTAGVVENFKSQNITASIIDLFVNLNLSNFYVFFDLFRHPIYLVTLSILIVFAVMRFIKRDKPLLIHNWVYILLYPPLFVWIWSIMDWPMFNRYFAIWTVITLILLFEMLNEVIVFYEKSWNKVYVFISGLLISYLLYHYSGEEYKRYVSEKYFPDIRSVFVHENKETKSIYTKLPLSHPNNSSFYLNYVGPFYDTKNRFFWTEERNSLFHEKSKNIRLDMNSVFSSFENSNLDGNFDLFAIVDCGVEVANPLCEFSPEELSINSVVPTIVKLGFSYHVYIYRNQNDLIKFFDQLFYVLEKKMGTSVWIFDYYLIKVYHLMHIKDYTEAKVYILKLIHFLNSSEFDSYFNKYDVLKKLNKYLDYIETNKNK